MTRLIHAISTRRTWFLLLPLCLIFASPYIIALLNRIFEQTGGNNLPPVPGALLAVVSFPFLIGILADSFLLSQALSYLLISALTLIICLWIMLRSGVGRAGRGIAVLTLVCLLVVPVVFRYRPDFTWLEQRGFSVYAVPSQQTFVDETVDGLVNILEMKACQHEILGWSAESILYYRTDCHFTPAAYWRFDPAAPQQVRQVGQVTDELVTTPQTLLLADSYPPTDHRSPDGRWIASVWAEFFYEPEHVIVVREPV